MSLSLSLCVSGLLSDTHTHTHTPTSNHTTISSSLSSYKSRFEEYNRLQSAAVTFAEKLLIPGIVEVSQMARALFWRRYLASDSMYAK